MKSPNVLRLLVLFPALIYGQTPYAQPPSAVPDGCQLISTDPDWPSPEVWQMALPGVTPIGPGAPTKRQLDPNVPHPNYRFKAKNAADVQSAVKFANFHNIRVSVITSGHDQQGRNYAASGLLIDLSLLGGFKALESFTPTEQGAESPEPGSESTPNVISPKDGVQAAVTFGPAVLGLPLNQALFASGLFVQTAAVATVTVSGGWGQNGGYGPLTQQYGLGVDQWLEAKIVTPDGELKVANAVTNTDLFWAIRGGGGGTFGIVVESTMKAYPNVPITGFNWYINATQRANGTDPVTGKGPISEAMAYLMGELPALQEKGVSAYIYAGNSQVRCYSIHPGNTSGVANANAVWGPILEKMSAFPGMTPFQTKPFEFANYKEFFELTYGNFTASPTPPDPTNFGIVPFDSRLLSAEHLKSPDLTAALAGTNGNYGIMMHAPGPHIGDGNDTSANPGWRKAVAFVVGWKTNTLNVDGLRKLAPDMGTYINEGSVTEPNWQTSFWGSNYARLSKIKAQLDPNMTFWVTPGIDAERAEFVNGRVCLVGNTTTNLMIPPATDGAIAADLEAKRDSAFGGQEREWTKYPANGTWLGLQDKSGDIYSADPAGTGGNPTTETEDGCEDDVE
ncbi:hypothetical protein HYFRA_00000742 [Hymenoscyphus fraxineus]|uniref:FAD-binding PCMH-type domain-containing protein n=1 Tax=Hymenoscyphus fraxineus TaxID=746836 RepID=A0A9N9KRX5_9HELO|nr:hypothetical protein HYFRA_00000742 [Hymenoscyphus fraxineus]